MWIDDDVSLVCIEAMAIEELNEEELRAIEALSGDEVREVMMEELSRNK